MDLLRQMQSDWLNLKPQWHRAILTAIGPDNFYSPAESEIRDRFSDLVQKLVLERPAPRTEEMKRWRQETRDASHEFEQAQRDVLFFLANLASEVFRGRLTPALAYDVVGLDVTRRSRQIRVLLGYDEARWQYETDDSFRSKVSDLQSLINEPEPDKADLVSLVEELSGVSLDKVGFDKALEEIQKRQDEQEFDCPWKYWVDSSPGLTDRILGLLDVLWAESAKLHDVETPDLVLAAQLKRDSGSGERNRRRIRRLCREHGSRLTGVRLERFLLNSEFISLGPPRRIRFLSHEEVPRELRGRGLIGRLRKVREFLRGRTELAVRSELVCDQDEDPDLFVRIPVAEPSEGFLTRLVLAGLVFLAFEAILIVLFGDYFYTDESSIPGAIGMVLVAAAGYFALGFFTRSWWSGALLLVMLLIAIAVEKPGPTVVMVEGATVAVRESSDLACKWLTYSIAFVPAWLLGLLSTRK